MLGDVNSDAALLITALVEDGKIISEAQIGTQLEDENGVVSNKVDIPAGFPYRALWDTGSGATVAVPRVIESAGLEQVGTRTGRSVDGTETTRPCYHGILVIKGQGGSNGMIGCEISKLERDGQLGDIDILIGMNLIQTGDFAISTDKQGKPWFTFRGPSLGQKICFRDRELKNKAKRKPKRTNVTRSKRRKR